MSALIIEGIRPTERIETAIRNVLAASLRAPRRMTRRGEYGKRLFWRVRVECTAYPDLVISQVGGGVDTVGDVTYKKWDESAAGGNVYQLLVHAAAFKYEVRRLGDAATDCDVTFFAVDVRNLHRDVDRLIADLELSSAKAPGVR